MASGLSLGVERAAGGLSAKLATAVVAEALAAVGADAGFVATVAEDGETVNVLRVTPHSESPVPLTFPVSAPYPLAAAIRTGRPLFIENNEQLACDHPGLVRVDPQDHACATLPLLDDDGNILGAVNLGFDDPHKFSAIERELIHVLGRECREAMALGQRIHNEIVRGRDSDR